MKEIHCKDRKALRKWLEKNYESKESVWLIIHKKNSTRGILSYNDAVEEGLCFGWIDSKPNKRDDDSYYVYFSVRSPKSKWSAVNKEKIERLMKNGLMMPAGLQLIELAKQSGTWDALNDVDAIVIPEYMQTLLQKNTIAKANFNAFPKSVKQGILQWISNAKTTTTRNKRIEETIMLAAENKRALQYPKPKK